MREDARSYRWLIALLGVALCARLGVSFWLPIDPASIERLPDQSGYLQIARNVLSGQGFKLHDPRFGQDLYAARMPGYPLFVAACGANVMAVRIVQAMVDVSTVLAVYLLARRMNLRAGGALAAAGLVAFNPFLVYFSTLVLSETLFTAMLAWGLLLLVRFPNFLWGGIVLVLAVYVRPSAVALPLVLAIAAAFVHRKTAPPTRGFWQLRLPIGSTMLLLTALALSPWVLRNWGVLNRWIWLTTNGGITLYDGFSPQATGASDQRFTQWPEFRGMRGLGEADRDQAYSRLAWDWVRTTWKTNPRHLADLSLAKAARTWSPVPLSEEFGSKRAYQLIAAAYSIPLFMMVVLGIWLGQLPRPAKTLLLLPAIYLTLIHMASVGSLRYRVPAEAPMCVLAAAGAAAIWPKRRPTGVSRYAGN